MTQLPLLRRFAEVGSTQTRRLPETSSKTRERINLFPSSVRDSGGGLCFKEVRINVQLSNSMTKGLSNVSDC